MQRVLRFACCQAVWVVLLPGMCQALPSAGVPASSGPPPVVVKAFGCDRSTGRCDLIIAQIPLPRVHGVISSSDLGLSISPDARWLACIWRGNLWYRRLGSVRWLATRVRPEWGRPVRLRWLPDMHGLLVLWGPQSNEAGLLNLETGGYTVLISRPEDERHAGREGGMAPFPGRVDVAESCGAVVVHARGVTSLFDRNARLRGILETESPLLAWSPDGSMAAIGVKSDETGHMSNTITMLDCKTFEMRREVFKDHPIDVEWSPDGKYIALITSKDGERAGCACTGIYPGTLAIFDPRSSRVTRYPQYSPRHLPTWSPNSRYLALGSRSIMDAGTGKARPLPAQLRKWAEGLDGASALWSPDGRYVLYSRLSQKTRRQGPWLLDTRTWSVIAARRDDQYLPRTAKPGDYVYPRVLVNYRDGRTRYEWGWHWQRLGQVICYDERNERTRHRRVLVGRVGSALRLLVAERPLAWAGWSRRETRAVRDMSRRWPGVG